jgi:hypothetical protein
MGYIKNIITAAIGLTLLFYFLNGLFAPAEAYYPEIVLMFIPESLHSTRLWESVFLDNPNFWYMIGFLSAIIAGWQMKRIVSFR